MEEFLSALKCMKSEEEVKLKEEVVGLLNNMAPSLHTGLFGQRYELVTLIKDLLFGWCGFEEYFVVKYY